MAGLMQEKMAEVAPMAPGKELEAEAPAAPAEGGVPPEASWVNAEGEMPENEYEDMVNRSLTAAFKVLSMPEMMEQQREVFANPTGEALGDFAFDVLSALQEKSGGSINDEAVPGILFGILAALAEVGEVPGPIVAQATQRSILRFLKQSGADPGQIEAALGNMDYNALAAQAEQFSNEEAGMAGEEDEEQDNG